VFAGGRPAVPGAAGDVSADVAGHQPAGRRSAPRRLGTAMGGRRGVAAAGGRMAAATGCSWIPVSRARSTKGVTMVSTFVARVRGVGLTVVVAGAMLTGCSFQDQICSSGEYPVKLIGSTTGG